MAVIELTEQNLKSSIEQNEILIIDFWGERCAPCKAFAPVFEATAAKNPDIGFAKCNTNLHPQIALTFGVQSVPTVGVFKGGVLIFLEAGALPGAVFEELVRRVREVDMAEVRAQMGTADAPPAPFGPGPEAPPSGAASRVPPSGGASRVPPSGAARGPSQGAPQRGGIVISEGGSSLTHLAGDPFLRRQGVSADFLDSVKSGHASPIAIEVLENYGAINRILREQGNAGREEARRKYTDWAFDRGRLKELDVETRSELLAVLRAIEGILNG